MSLHVAGDLLSARARARLAVQAQPAYYACMQYTLRNVPKALDQALRRRAHRANKSLNEVAIEALGEALGVSATPIRRRDLREIAGSWEDDPLTDEVLDEQRRIDPDLWR